MSRSNSGEVGCILFQSTLITLLSTAPSPARARVSLTNVVNNNIGAGLVVYTDGACKNNQGGGASKLAGLGVYFGDDDER
jgi:xanthine dehydrogenase molybdopterin-binding subunit B